MFGVPPEFKSYWLTPAAAGVFFILIGVMIFKYPRLVEYLVATVFVVVGVILLLLAWQMRGRVTYRRIDDVLPPDEPGNS